MSVNKPLFDELYVECKNIIQLSNDKNIKSKETKLDFAYKKLCEEENAELQEFYSVLHELRTYDYLQKKNYIIKSQNDNNVGPDFYVEGLGYIECISITKGEEGTVSREYINKLLAGTFNRYKSALPRISSALIDKKIKFETYLNNKIIKKDIPRVIAINTSVFSNEFHSSLIIDLAQKILYGIGCQTINFKEKQVPGVETHTFDIIGNKNNDKQLELGYFYNDDFKNISAVIITNNSVGEVLEDKYFNVYLNFRANCPICLDNIKNIRYFGLKSLDEKYVNFEWHNIN